MVKIIITVSVLRIFHFCFILKLFINFEAFAVIYAHFYVIIISNIIFKKNVFGRFFCLIHTATSMNIDVFIKYGHQECELNSLN